MADEAATEWTLATVLAAARPVAAARGFGVRGHMAGGTEPTRVHIELLRGDVVTSWLEILATWLDDAEAQPYGVAQYVEVQVAAVIRKLHGPGAAA